MADCTSENRPEASATRRPARLSTRMILRPEPSRKSVNVVSAVSKVVSAPANAGPANQRQANRRRAMATIARSVRPLFFRTDCMLGSLHMETRRIRAQVKGWSDALRGCNGRPEEVPSIRPSFCDSRLFYHGHGARCPDIRGGLPVKKIGRAHV